MSADAWRSWQRGVITTVCREYRNLFPYLQQNDIDWDAWRPLFEQGYEPVAAVAEALSGSGVWSSSDERSDDQRRARG